MIYFIILFLFQNWNLRIRNVELSDGGMYECQATTHPPQSIFVNLRVVGELSQPEFTAIHHRHQSQ